jgi:hypothetical protein
VPGDRITDRQVTRYMTLRRTHSQEAAAAKVAISPRSARRIEAAPILPSQRPRRWWRSRSDPLVDVWDSEVVPLLLAHPGLLATSILQHLQERHPGRFHGVLRTLQRRIRQWRALSGPPREIFFPQRHEPGRLALSDFTDAGELGVTIANVPLAHRLYHFALAFSGWEHVEVIEGGESFVALAHGLQNALWQAGGVPAEHRTDSLSAARAGVPARRQRAGWREPAGGGRLHCPLRRALPPLRYEPVAQQPRPGARERDRRGRQSPSQDRPRPGADAARPSRFRDARRLPPLRP